MEFKESASDELIHRQLTGRGLELVWKREDGTRYSKVIPQGDEYDAYFRSEGLDPREFFPEIHQ